MPPSYVLVRPSAGSFVDTVRVGHAASAGTSSYSLAYEHAGTYAVMVDAEGYRAWTRAGVTVTRGECNHVRPVKLTARLQR